MFGRFLGPEMVGDPAARLNAICPYFTMFPLDFPLGILERHARSGQRVLDPFCGRGTTNVAARALNMHALGIDSSPVATAITTAKIVSTTPDDIMREVQRIIASAKEESLPRGAFWARA